MTEYGVQWVRRSLPHAGGSGEQDTKTMQAISHVAGIELDLLLRRTQRSRPIRPAGENP